jgi:serine/threonine-protein kinase
LGWLGWAYAKAGRGSDAKKLLQELQDQGKNTNVSSSSFAVIHIGIGDIDKASQWYEKAIDERDGMAFHLHIHPLCDPLREHATYPMLMGKMNMRP